MDEALRGVLLGHAPIGAMVARRIDWGVRPQGSPLPGISLHRASGAPQMNMSGAAEWSRDRVQIDCWGRTYKAANDLALLIAGQGGLLVGYRGDHLGMRLRTFIVGRRSGHDTDDHGVVHLSSIDAMIWSSAVG